jgi:hypothetical protein
MRNALRGEKLAWLVTLGLLALYLVGLVLGWGATSSWHLLAVIVAVLLIYNVLSMRGR